MWGECPWRVAEQGRKEKGREIVSTELQGRVPRAGRN